jgi:hypothetical protein
LFHKALHILETLNPPPQIASERSPSTLNSCAHLLVHPNNPFLIHSHSKELLIEVLIGEINGLISPNG